MATTIMTGEAQMTLRQLLDAYANARLARRTADMERLNAEINRRQQAGETA